MVPGYIFRHFSVISRATTPSLGSNKRLYFATMSKKYLLVQKLLHCLDMTGSDILCFKIQGFLEWRNVCQEQNNSLVGSFGSHVIIMYLCASGKGDKA